MKKRWLCVTLSIILLSSLVSCSADLPVNLGEAELTEGIVETENVAATGETSQNNEQTAEEQILFKEFDLLKIEREANSIENGFVQADFVIQNKSDRLTISNFVFEYLVDNGSGTPLDETFYTDDDGLFALGPRQKAELKLMEYIGAQINEDMRIYIVSYSYDLNENHYVVDIPTQTMSVIDKNNRSNVTYEDKHILHFESDNEEAKSLNILVNTGELDIKTLDISVAVYDENSVLQRIKTITVVAAGEKPVGIHDRKSFGVEPIFTEKNGYIIPVRYAYSTGSADNQGYNFYEINLITGESLGSTNLMLMDVIFDVPVDALRNEIEQYTNTFGKKITDTSLDGYEIDERVGSEWLHFYNSTLFDIQGIATLVRDYDTLILTDFWFVVENHDETTAAYLLKVLEFIYGEEYTAETENGRLKQAVWDLEEYSVEYDAEYGNLHIDTDIG